MLCTFILLQQQNWMPECKGENKILFSARFICSFIAWIEMVYFSEVFYSTISKFSIEYIYCPMFLFWFYTTWIFLNIYLMLWIYVDWICLTFDKGFIFCETNVFDTFLHTL